MVKHCNIYHRDILSNLKIHAKIKEEIFRFFQKIELCGAFKKQSFDEYYFVAAESEICKIKLFLEKGKNNNYSVLAMDYHILDENLVVGKKKRRK